MDSVVQIFQFELLEMCLTQTEKVDTEYRLSSGPLQFYGLVFLHFKYVILLIYISIWSRSYLSHCFSKREITMQQEPKVFEGYNILGQCYPLIKSDTVLIPIARCSS